MSFKNYYNCRPHPSPPLCIDTNDLQESWQAISRISRTASSASETTWKHLDKNQPYLLFLTQQ